MRAHIRGSRDEARQKYPKETKELEAHLGRWREKLRASVPRLLDGNVKSKKETVEQKDALGKK